MIICPNCAHPNPDGVLKCEACYTALPGAQTCPNCSAIVESDAEFCGQCGYGLRSLLDPGSAETEMGMTSPPPSVPAPVSNPPAVSPPISSSPSPNGTRLQTSQARLFHVQSNTTIELPIGVSVVHLGKPNDRIPPDIDVSGLADSDIVSRIHADIRLEGDAYYIEDVGSANGTYINAFLLPVGDRHRLRSGDRIALGKGDKVSFLFQST